MNNLVEIASRLAKNWSRTLQDFRDEATREFNGTKYESLRADSGQRFIIAACFTGEHEIKKVLGIFELVEDSKPELDWSVVTLGDRVMQTAFGSGFSYEAQRDTIGRPTSIVLIAAEPRSITMLERALGLQP